MKRYIYFITSLLSFWALTSYAQYAPAAGVPGTNAMYKDSSAFVGWATSAHVVFGYQDISLPSNGYTNVGDSSSTFGKAGANGVVSLGDGGYALLQFDNFIADELGADFAVFENSFDDQFLELAFVEVSSDGVNFFRFPAISNTDTVTQTNSFGYTDATKLNNLAGKYRGLYGTPFDLADITDNALLNKQAITHVKVIDVIGCIQNQYCTRDANNHKINDPWPTAFGSGGFDLDAVGIIHQKPVSVNELSLETITFFPNPANDYLYINGLKSNTLLTITNLIGEIIFNEIVDLNKPNISVKNLQEGAYVLTITFNGKQKQLKFLKA